jgi:hypothetical protein
MEADLTWHNNLICEINGISKYKKSSAKTTKEIA